jgi:biotin carboxyl carrier protein
MDLIVRHDEREESVRIRRDGDVYEVTLGDKTWRVEAGAVGKGVHSLRVDGGHHEVAVRPQGEGVYWVSTPHGAGPVTVSDPLTHLAAQAAGGKGGRRQQKVTAYMPGRVVAVLVQEGEEVQAGQGVVVLEAMKMENEIRAESDGTIRQVFVTPGQAVEGGDPLFELV